MKTIKSIAIAMILFAGFTSCSSEDDTQQNEKDPMVEFDLVAKINGNGHTVELYSENNALVTGYNEIYIRIKDNADNGYFRDAEITWTPMMQMMDKAHSAPRSAVTLTGDRTVSKGFVVFQMPGTEEEYWELTVNYRLGGRDYTSVSDIGVKMPLDQKRRVATFMGSDEVRYVLAMAGPQRPKVGVNDMRAMLFRMENSMDFPSVANYKIGLDPRMPAMGNHGTPNNTDLTYDAGSGSYNGKLNLSMTGYWKLNLKLWDAEGELLKGEDVNGEQEASSLFFELEF